MRQIEITDKKGVTLCYYVDSKPVCVRNNSCDAFEKSEKGAKFVKEFERSFAIHRDINTKLDLTVSQISYLFDEIVLEDTRGETIMKIFDLAFMRGIKYQKAKQNRDKCKKK